MEKQWKQWQTLFWGAAKSLQMVTAAMKLKDTPWKKSYDQPAAATAKSLQSCPTDSVRPHRRKPTRLPRPWDSPGKNTGVGCHFLLQCMKVKSESEVAQSHPTLSDPMDCSLPGFVIRGIFQARELEWGAIAFSMTNLDSILKIGDITLSTKVHLVKAMIFPVQSEIYMSATTR